MKKVFLSALIFAFVLSCEKKTENNITEVKKDSMAVNESDFTVEEIPHFCYVGAVGKDSVFVHIDDNLGTITGKIHYKNYEKDSSSGEIMGYKNGDTLKVDYVFNSEGMESTREIWFLQSKDELLEGIGTMDGEGNYTNPSQVKFEGGHLMKSVDCEGFEKNF